MRSAFPGYYRPKAYEFVDKFKECVFCFDTNVLLNLYRFTPESRDNLLTVLQHPKIKDRIWLPHRVGLEYHRNRTDELVGQLGLVSKAEGVINDAIANLEALRRSSMFAVNALIDPIKADLEAVKAKLHAQKVAKPDLMSGDKILDALTELFDGKVGKPFSAEEEKAIFKKGKERYETKAPPGFKDRNANNPNDTDQYGDLILWLQVIDFAKSQDRPVVIVTDDAKEDWWRQVRGETLGPRPELIEEFARETGGKWFHMYSTEQFLKNAKEHLEAPVTPDAIKEAEDIKTHDAEEQKRVTRIDIKEALDALERGDPAAVAAAADAITRTRRSRSVDFGSIDAALSAAYRMSDFSKIAESISAAYRVPDFSKINTALSAAYRIPDFSKIDAALSAAAKMPNLSGILAAAERAGQSASLVGVPEGAQGGNQQDQAEDSLPPTEEKQEEPQGGAGT